MLAQSVALLLRADVADFVEDAQQRFFGDQLGPNPEGVGELLRGEHPVLDQEFGDF